MICPRCHGGMVERCFGPVQVDVCDCGGLWFDWAELAAVDEPAEGFGEALARALAAPPARDTRARLRCSACRIPMREHRYGADSRVLVDHCYECRGSFLDPGELAAIREEIGQRSARDQRVQEILEADPVWQAQRLELAAETERTRSAQAVRDVLMKRVKLWLVALGSLGAGSG